MPFCLEPARVKRRTHRQISIIQTDSIHASASTAPDGELDALKHSIARLGLLSPILVRARGNGYELVAGARRLADWRMDNANAHVHSLANATENRYTERSDPDIPSAEYAKYTTDEYRPRRSTRTSLVRDSTVALRDKRVIDNEHIENATQIPSDCLNADAANTAGQTADHQKTRAVRRRFRREHACSLKCLGDDCAQKSHEKSIAIDEEAPISAEITNGDPVHRLLAHSASHTNMNTGSPKADPIAQTPSASNAEPREANGSSAPEQRDSPGETIACNPAVSGCAAARSRAVGSVRLRAESASDMDRLMDQLLGEELAHMRKKHVGGLTLSL